MYVCVKYQRCNYVDIGVIINKLISANADPDTDANTKASANADANDWVTT